MRLVLVDRDGTINVRRPDGYIDRVEDVVFLEGSIGAFAKLARAGIGSAIVTNQAGIGRGLVQPADVARVNAHVLQTLRAHGADVEHVYCCPHAPADDCACRKPRPGLLLRALRERDVAPENAVLIGDSASDVAAGQAAGVRTILVLTGRGREDRDACPGTATAANLEEAVDRLLDERTEERTA